MSRLGAARRDLARHLAAAREDFLSTGLVPGAVRPLVAQSWQRSLAAGARAEADGAPLALPPDLLAAYRQAHPLWPVLPLVRELLVADAAEAGFLVAVTDASGVLLWVDGHLATCDAAAGMNFVPGARWSEAAVGTNAPGTALATDRLVQIFASEHLADPVTRWSCTAAPVHHPRTGALLGAIDVTGDEEVVTPFARSLVQAVATAVEARLLVPPAADTPAAGPSARLAVLGRDRAVLRTPRGEVVLSPRHSELLLVLAAHPDGLSGEQLQVMLHDREGPRVTVRAELSRLRTTLGAAGGPALCTRPYRLDAPLGCDATEVAQRLAAGDVAGALRAYAGPVLPASTAPAVVEVRDDLHGDLRAAVLGADDPGLLRRWAALPGGHDDLDVWAALAGAEPPASAGRAIARDRALRLDRALGA